VIQLLLSMLDHRGCLINHHTKSLKEKGLSVNIVKGQDTPWRSVTNFMDIPLRSPTNLKEEGMPTMFVVKKRCSKIMSRI